MIVAVFGGLISINRNRQGRYSGGGSGQAVLCRQDTLTATCC
jgi:hypothetical protein